jgi:hypothetical protein
MPDIVLSIPLFALTAHVFHQCIIRLTVILLNDHDRVMLFTLFAHDYYYMHLYFYRLLGIILIDLNYHIMLFVFCKHAYVCSRLSIVNIISSSTMDNAGSSTQPVPKHVGRRRCSTHINVPQVSTETSRRCSTHISVPQVSIETSRRCSTHISVPQVNTETSHGNRRTRKARLNSVAEQDSLGNECTYFS